MKCSNCGKEIREGNSFCTNCGTKAVITSNNNNIENTDNEQANIPLNVDVPNADNAVAQDEVNNIKAKKKIPTVLKIIIPIVVILAVILIIVLCNNKNDEEASIDEVIETVEETGTSSIETGVKYYYIGENKSGYLKFNSETAFIIKMDYDTADYQFTGTYTIDDNIITLTVTFDSFIEDIEAFEPYTETMTILEDETIEWVTNAETYIFDKNLTIEETTTNTVSSEELLEQIYALYPALEDTDGIICTDGDSYWLLDESGNKVYFYDLDSFESALTQCNIDVDNLGDTTEDTSTTTTNSTSTSNNTTSSSTSKSTNSTSSNSSSQNTNSSSTTSSSTSSTSTSSSSETTKWTTTVSISPYQRYIYDGVYTGTIYAKWKITSDSCYYFSYLSQPSSVTLTDNTNRGAKYYIDGSYVGEINSESDLTFQYTFDKTSSITIKVVAPYIYKTDGTYIASNITLSEKTISVSSMYDSSYYDKDSNVLSIANFF